jgi:hypothetical protein
MVLTAESAENAEGANREGFSMGSRFSAERSDDLARPGGKERSSARSPNTHRVPW